MAFPPTTTARNTAATVASGPHPNRRRPAACAGAAGVHPSSSWRARRRRRASSSVRRAAGSSARAARAVRAVRCASRSARHWATGDLGRGEARLVGGELSRRQRHDAIGVVVVHGHASVGCRFGGLRFPNSSASRRRPRNSRDFTVPTGTSSTPAAVSSAIPSRSTRTMAARNSGQGGQRPLDVGAELGGLDRLLGPGVGSVVVLGELVDRPALLTAEVVVAHVHRHPVEPGAEGRLGPVPIGLAEQGHERVLGGVERRLAVPEHPQADGEHPVAMDAHQLVEGAEVAAEVPLDQIHVGGGIAHRGGLWSIPRADSVARADSACSHRRTR